MTVDFKDADIRDVLRAIGTQFRINIVIDKEVQGTVTVHLHEVPVIEGLTTLLESNGFTFTKQDDIYLVRKAEKDKKMAVQATATRLSVDVQKYSVEEVLREISRQSGVNIVADQSVRGDITGLLQNVPFDVGLSSLLNANGFLIRKRAGIYEVTRAPGEPGRRKGLSITVEEEQLLTMDVSDADLGSVLQEITSQTGINIVTYGEIRGLVNAKLERKPLDDVLSLILQGTTYTFRRADSVYLIGDKSLGSPASQALISTKLLKLKHIKADIVPTLLPPSIPVANVKVIKEQNALLVMGTEDFISRTEEFLRTIDLVSPQVMIEALIVELTKNAQRDLSLRGGYFRPDSVQQFFPSYRNYVSGDDINKALDEIADQMKVGRLGKLPTDFMTAITALETAGKARVRARPRIATLNGNGASISVATTGYYETTTTNQQGYTLTQLHSIQAGISLKITPWVAASGEITTEINQEVSNSIPGAQQLPEVSSRAASTTIRLRDGETIIIGGLIQTSRSESREKIPILGDIPLLGRLFSDTTEISKETELIIYITPHILPSEEGYVQ
jgi:type IV pilus assembly protein PilQ